jgi:XRE family transcriptional regulator, aerobic/anaerobic benzoate catabolism transcriptional regulator
MLASNRNSPAIEVSQSNDASALEALAVRVRDWRARRGMTRKALAQDSGLSLRFLADIEAGKGNPSVQSLVVLAQALNIDLTDLLSAAPASSAHERATRLITRLGEAQAQRAGDWMLGEFNLQAPLRSKRLALIGLRGAGKSTLGQYVAQARGLPFVELDKEVEREAGMPLAEVISLYGQAGWRRYEQRALDRIAQAHEGGVVLTTGGGIVSEREAFEALLAQFYCVWVKASPEEHMARVVEQGDMRPFSATRGANSEALADIRSILKSREALYARADAQIETSGRAVAECQQVLLKVFQQAAGAVF